MVAAARGAFRAIQIRVENGGIQFDRVIIHYGNGSSSPTQIRKRIPAGDQTRVIALPGGPRIIRGVEFWYQRGNWRGRPPRVRLFGIR
jgi:hypothetical protein